MVQLQQMLNNNKKQKAATIIQHHFRTKKEMNEFAKTNLGQKVRNQLNTIRELILELRRRNG